MSQWCALIGRHVGKLVADAAAKFLTPVNLELGGKSPTIVDKSANLEHAAKRIAWASFMNSGQTCVRPDFGLVHQDVADKFLMARSSLGPVPVTPRLCLSYCSAKRAAPCCAATAAVVADPQADGEGVLRRRCAEERVVWPLH